MKATIITIGDELLIGQTIDTNSAWIGSEMSSIGFDVQRIISIHDRRNDILATLGEVSGNNDVVLITGGLGPTSDDITKQTLCEYFNTKLVLNERVLEMVTEMLARRNFRLNERNRCQAEVPEDCSVLENRTGTAPGMWFEKNNTIYVSMPGVPHEMKYIMTEHVLPELTKRFTSQVIIHKNIMTYGLPEAMLAEQLESFEKELPGSVRLAYLPASGVIKLRLTGTGNCREQVRQIIDQQVGKLYSTIPRYIYSEDEAPIEKVIGLMLQDKKATLCTAESCTGGAIAGMITSIPGSSFWYKGSVVAYSNEIKTRVLGVPEGVIARHGAVSREVVTILASGARKVFKTDYAVATSGIAGPDGGTDEKPVGTVWIAVASPEKVVTEKYVFGNERLVNIRRFSLAALDLLRKQIKSS
ncbi:MAG TPA: competence/damage-inducible protein A [Bacteroidales bacterium]|nr:competence/damage-inducible protein A [Bacteroidales bacterium]